MNRISVSPVAIILGIFLLSGIVFIAVSQSSASNMALYQDVRETPVELADLPAPVRETLKGKDFENWNPVEAKLVADSDGPYYKIKISSGQETKTVRIDREGKKIKNKDK